MFIVCHSYIRALFDWWLWFHQVVILIWLLWCRSLVCKFQFEKHDFPWKHTNRAERVLLHDIEQGGQKQTGESLLRPQTSKANSSVNLSTNLLRFYMLRFQLIMKRDPLSTNVLYFQIQPELVESGFVSNMCSFVQFCWPMIMRCRNIKKKKKKKEIC